MSREVRRRVFLAAAIPLGAAIFVAVMLWAFSRVLLAVDPRIAPLVALLFALNVLVGCAFAAILRGRRSFTLVLGTMIAVVLASGVAAAFVGEQPVGHAAAGGEHAGEPTTEPTGEPTEEPTEEPTAMESPTGEPTEEPTGEAGGEAVPIAADDLAFSTETLELPAGGQVTIAFDNQDTPPHNVAIYESEGGEPIFQGEIIDGGTQIEYTFEAPEPGEYYFQCDVHPFMNGTAVVG